MTLQELAKHFQLRERLARSEQILQSLQSAALPGAQVLTGMPHTPGVKDRVGDLAVEIADMKDSIQALQEEIAKEAIAIELFISSIEDGWVRTILRLRFIRCLTWGEVAAILGGRNTEDGVKSACYRFLSEESCNAMTRHDAP